MLKSNESINSLTHRNKNIPLKVILGLNFIALSITFALNFLGMPVLKYHYLVHVIITFIAVSYFDITDIFPVILTLFFIEGQGRILWEYAGWARIVFDATILFAIIRLFIKKKKIISLDRIPALLVLIIAMHFLWYAVEFTNLYSVSAFAILAATKVYIYPLLFFFGMTQLSFEVDSEHFQKTLNFFTFILVLELGLTFYQFTLKENHVLKISSYYYKAMSGGVFTGMLYRPFGTTPLPGAVSTFLFLTVGLLFLRKSSKINYLIRMTILFASGFAIILCQVRSAFVKFLLIIILIHLGEIFYYRLKLKGFISLIPILIVLIAASQFMSGLSETESNVDLTYVKDRITSLADVNKVRGARANASVVFSVINQKLSENPMGIGPGLTGAAGSLSQDLLKDNPFVNSGMTWTYDNLLISLVIDFGYGAIFYLLMLLYIPVYFFRFLIKSFRTKSYHHYKILLVCFSSIVVIIVGNWGAVGITYNPESFAFWLFVSLGFSTIATYKQLPEPNDSKGHISLAKGSA